MNGSYLKALENRAKKIHRAPDQTEDTRRVRQHLEQLFPRSTRQFPEKHMGHHEAERPGSGGRDESPEPTIKGSLGNTLHRRLGPRRVTSEGKGRL